MQSCFVRPGELCGFPMKLTTLLLTLALAGLAQAESKLPRGTFGFKDLEKAKT